MPLLSKVKDIFHRGSSAKKKKVYHNVLLDNPEEIWQIIGELGDGAYGKVYKAQHKLKGIIAALKQVELEGEDDLDNFMIEIDILSDCKHQNIVELLEAYHYEGKLWMYLEYCDGGAVDSIMVDLDRPLNEGQIAYLCRELCKALKYIHSQKVIHRDLKAGNVLLTMDGGVKLADFGVSAKNKNTFDKRGTFIGTPYWLAPEVILCETFIDAKYDYKADIWSLGISLIEFAQMDPPHHEVSPVRVMLKIQKSEPPKLDYPSRWSKNFNDFIGKCLIKDPLQRPDTDDLLKHPFISRDLPLKPIKDLVLEYNAEVEEIVEEENEEQDNSRVPELMTNIDSFGKDGTRKATVDKLSSPTKEVPPITPAERKISKGPAPLPPVVNSTAQMPSTKGPAPATPVVVDSQNKLPTLSTTTTSPTDKISLTQKQSLEKDKIRNTPLKNTSALDSTKILLNNEEKSVSELPSKKKKIEDAVKLAPTGSEKSSATAATDVKSVHISEIVTSGHSPNSTSKESALININEVVGISSSSVIPKKSSNGTVTVPVTATSENSTSLSSNKLVGSEPSEVLLASISSEGTVIVRTPTPTPTSSDISQHSLLDKKENIVTYTVAEEAGEHPESHISSSDTIVTPKSTPPESPVDSSKICSPNPTSSTVSPTHTFSISEAEAQAMLILETAINSALDNSSYKNSETCSATSSVPGSPSFSDHVGEEPLPSDALGEVVVVPSEHEKDDIDNSGHKLDESEVVISNSSILQDETKPYVCENESTPTTEDAAHVSVISVEEDKNDADYDRQTSLTIKGTTLEATDVDDDDIDNHSNLQQVATNAISTSVDSGIAKESPQHSRPSENETLKAKDVKKSPEVQSSKSKSISNGIRRQSSRSSERSDVDTISTISSDKENRHRHDDSDFGEDVILRSNSLKKSQVSPVLSSKSSDSRSNRSKELQESIALRRKTRKRTRRFEIDGVIVTTTTSKVIYGDDEEDTHLSSAHLARKQELREIKILQKQEQKQFQELSAKAELARYEQERKFENEKISLTRNYDSQIENLNRQQKQQVEKAEVKQESELKIASKKIRSEQERELKNFRESLKQELKLLKQEVDFLPKDRRKETLKFRKEKLDRNQAEREKAFLENLNENHEIFLKRLNDEHREHIALKERQFLEEKHQLMRARENSLWEMEERHLRDKHQLAKEQLKDVYFLQRHQMLIRHNKELEQVRRMNAQKEDELLKRQQVEKRQLPKRIRQEMKTREKMFREKIRISMTTLPSQEDEKEQLRKFQELEKIKYDAERKRAEKKHGRQFEELKASIDYAIKELEILQNEKGKVLMEHETYKLKSLDEEYHKELKEWKTNLMPRKQKLEDGFERQLSEQERFYGDYLKGGLGATPSQSTSSMSRSTSFY